MKNLTLVAVAALILSACQTVYVPQAREVKKKPKVIGSLIINDTNDDIDTQCVLLQLDDRLDYLEAGELVAVRITKQI